MGRNNGMSPAWCPAALVVVMFALLVSCQYNPPRGEDLCSTIENLPVTELTAQGRSVVQETPGTILLMSGFGTARLGSGGYLKVEERADIPGYANSATVFLNGWRVRYTGDDDQHVRAFGTMIGKIRPEGRQLVWNAVGLLRDNDAKEGYEWTYHYVIIAWNDAALNVVVNHDDAERFCGTSTPGSDNFFFARNGGTTTALASFSTFIESPDFPSNGRVAVLPRGFGFAWDDDDHCMLHLGYSIDHGTNLIEAGRPYKKASGEETPLTGGAGTVDSRFVAWDAHAILKDNDGRRGYLFAEMASACGGADVGVIEPPFSILPIEDSGRPCVTEEGASESHAVSIRGIPFEYAIPVLTGWQLGYGQLVRGCDDEHVQEMGIWIDEWSYVRPPGSPAGTLECKLSSVLRDKDSEPGHFHRNNVAVLGLKPVTPGSLPSQRLADLVPFSPLGVDAAAYCRLEDNRKVLRVGVKNIGPGDAGPSKTTVDFGILRSTQRTPALPSGASVDLVFKVPGACFDPDCEFRIIVDSDHEVDESNEGNNAASGSCLQ